MPCIEETLIVGEGGHVALRVDRPAGARMRVLLVDESEMDRVAPLASSGLPAGPGFAREVLADPAEDVWNDL